MILEDKPSAFNLQMRKQSDLFKTINLFVICESVLERKQNFGKVITLCSTFLRLRWRDQGIVEECKIRSNF